MLTRSGVTDIATGFKNKQVVMPADSVALAEPETYFVDDSVKLFKDTDLTQEAGRIPFYGIVYPYQASADKDACLWRTGPNSTPTVSRGCLSGG